MNTQQSTLLIWDSENQPPKGAWTTVLWRSFGDANSTTSYSLPKLIEEQEEVLRSRYLAWIHDLGEAPLNGKRLVDHLSLRPGFSYWWMTLPTLLSYGANTSIYKAIRMFALEQLVEKLSVNKIILVSSEKLLARTVRLWCKNTGFVFEWQRLSCEPIHQSLRGKLYRLLPRPVQAIVHLLRYIKDRWPLKQVCPTKITSTREQITFCSYFHNLNMEAARQGNFYSYYWTVLSEVLVQESIRTNWLHLYVPDSVPTAQQAQDLVDHFNQNRSDIQFHTTLDGVLSWAVIRKTLLDYGRLLLMGLRLRTIHQYFQPIDSRINFWPLLKQEWDDFLFGSPALSNCLFLNLFEDTLKQLPHQQLGFYLQENQAWEMAFIYAWKATGHGQLIGVPHATVQYWDLRYFSDPRSYQSIGTNNLPLPDKVALNSSNALSAYRQGGFPKNRLVEVEALRYLYLADLPFVQKSFKEASPRPLRILVLGDYMPSTTYQQMQWLVEADSSLPADTYYIVKPHPSCPIKQDDYPTLQIQVVNSPLAELLSSCNVAYTSNLTTAAVDAYSTGIPVLSVLDGNALNMSPLRGLEDVKFVSSPQELAEALLDIFTLDYEKFKKKNYFTIDLALPRWKALLSQFKSVQG